MTDPKHPRKQHFVPQFLLSNFCDESRPCFVIDKALRESSRLPKIVRYTVLARCQEAYGSHHASACRTSVGPKHAEALMGKVRSGQVRVL